MPDPHPDLPGLAALHRDDAALVDRLARRLAAGAGLLTYRTEGVLRGYLLFTPVPGGAPLIERLYVAPGWRRRGIEARLCRRLPQPAQAAAPGEGREAG